MRSKPTENSGHRMLCLGFLILTVTIFEVAGSWNFTEHVENYIQELNSTMLNITSWGMTKDYSYWSDSAEANNTLPITATAGAINLMSSFTKLSPLIHEYQFEVVVYFLNLTKSIYGHFLLPAHFSFELYESQALKEKNVTFYMNNITRAKQWSAVYRTTRLPVKRQSINKQLFASTMQRIRKSLIVFCSAYIKY
ncbi:hypothetical protein V5799_019311 [Amblyomma americanum]|uniref:Secreted protein n=1 Tax=Amblyomma americanum TaxID=6943 RepID=A0AAQ4EX56_AMBAM